MAGAALWFTALQVRALAELCPYCLAVHGCGILIGLLVWARLSMLRRRGLAPRVLPAGLAGLAALAALVGGQVLGPDDSSGAAAAAADHRFPGFVPGTRPATAPSPQSFLNGAVTIDAADYPLLGDPAAPHRLAVLADYTCGDCRAMHAMLVRAHRRYGGRFAVLLLPMPLDASCNSHVRNTLPRHKGACELARLALAVWRADPSRFAEMDAWLFAPRTPPTAAAARQYAAMLVGEEALRRAEADPWVQRAVQSGVRTHNTSSGEQIPKLLLPRTLVVGRIKHEAQLFGLLEEEFRIKPTPLCSVPSRTSATRPPSPPAKRKSQTEGRRRPSVWLFALVSSLTRCSRSSPPASSAGSRSRGGWLRGRRPGT